MSISFRLCGIVLLVTLSQLAAPASPKAAPLISRGAYSETATKSCGSATSCTAVFSPIPNDRTLIVHNLSCYVFHSSSVNPLWFRFTGNGRNVFIPLRNSSTLGGLKRYFLNESVFAPFAGGQTPAAALFLTTTSASNAVTCTIGGELRQ